MILNRLSSRVVAARSLVAVAGLVGVASSPALAQQVDSTWLSPVSGTWNVATNWSTSPNAPNNGSPAGATYRAIIDATGAAYTVTLNSGVTIDELMLNSADATLTHTGGTFSAALVNLMSGVYRLQGGTISGGTWNAGGGSFQLTLDGGTLADVEFNGAITANATNANATFSGSSRFHALHLHGANSRAILDAGYTLRDPIVADGVSGGTRYINNNASGNYTIAGGGSVVLSGGSGGDLSIRNFLGNFALANDGLISAQAAGRTLTIFTTSFDNNGMVEATAGTLSLSSLNWTNSGAIHASNATLNLSGAWANTGSVHASNATLNLSGSWSNEFGEISISDSLVRLGGEFTTSALGTITRSGGTVELTGTLDNTMSTLTLDASTGSWRIRRGTINGGTVNALDGSTLVLTTTIGALTGATLSSVQINGDLLADEGWADVTLIGSTRFDALRLRGANSSVRFDEDYILRDAIIGEGMGGGTRWVRSSNESAVMIADTGSIVLAPGSASGMSISNTGFYGPFPTLVNEGLISAQAEGRSLGLRPDVFVNNGTLQVAAGGLTVAADTWTNAGLIDVSGGTLTLDGTWDATNGVGSFSRSGGTVTLRGTMNNTGNSFFLDDSTGSWRLFGTINGGTITAVAGNTLLFTSNLNHGTLNNVQFNGDLLTDLSGARIQINGSTRFDAVRLRHGDALAILENGYILRDAILAEGVAGGARRVTTYGPEALVIADTGSVVLASGSGGDLQISPAALVNNGSIAAHAAGRSLLVTSNAFTNNGTLEAQNSSVLRVSTAGVHSNSADLVVGTNGRIEFVNGFEQTSSGVFTVELSGGTNAGAGRLAITGDATLGGTLDLDPVGGFEPTWNNAWTIATTTGGSIVGDFDTILFPTLANGDHRWWTEVNATSYRVGVRHFADLNYDGVVNFADLNIVLGGFGTSGTFREGDTNGDGVVNFADLNNILGFFGLSAPREVPAPGAAVVLALGGAIVASRRRGTAA